MHLHRVMKNKAVGLFIVIGRCTYIKELVNELHIGLFQGNKAAKEKAKQNIIAHINRVMNASYGDEIEVTHKCNPSQKGTVDEIFHQRPLQLLYNACHKNLCNDVRGKY